ncbi:hypothetical protein AVEN_157870-1 [Araneus ventricosus]|uniref:Endonuclease/exonuclease/phosphatase domain-containing protein n=1 Tax=Araneus ventricosus TaxID=182803 RepID=A0A4Y2EA09_ARAVE|nr:hypothetical protein AVEN_157870-1 [Araneus ventricosus]
MDCPSEVDTEKILEKIGNKPCLQEKVKQVQIKQQLSKYIVYGLEPETAKEDIEKALFWNFGDLGDKNLNVLFPIKGKTGNTHWVFQTPLSIYHLLKKRKKNYRRTGKPIDYGNSRASRPTSSLENLQVSQDLGNNACQIIKRQGLFLYLLASTSSSSKQQKTLQLLNSKQTKDRFLLYQPIRLLSGNIHDTLQELDTILTNIGDEKALIGADVNAHRRVSGYKNEEHRGIEDLGHQLFLLNETNSPLNFREPRRKRMTLSLSHQEC